MGKWANRTCHECGITRSVNVLRKKTVSANSGRSGTSFSFGQRKKSIRVHTGRKYYRKKEVWVCAHSAACGDPNYFVRLAAERAEEETRLAEEKKKEETRLAEEKKKEETRLAEEKKKEETRLAEESEKKAVSQAKKKRRNERIEKEIKRQKADETAGEYISEKAFVSKADLSTEISDCASDIAEKQDSLKMYFWSSLVLIGISSFFLSWQPENSILLALYFLLVIAVLIVSVITVLIFFWSLLRAFFTVLGLKKRLTVLKRCMANIEKESSERKKTIFLARAPSYISSKRKRKTSSKSSSTDKRKMSRKSPKEEAPKSPKEEAPKSPKEEAPKSPIDKLIESDDFFNIATTVLAKSIAEADGELTKEEYDAYCENFEIDKEDFKLVEKIWSKNFSPSAFAKELAKRYRKKKLFLEVILNNLFFVAEADGAISSKEEEMLRNYATIFGLSPEKFARLVGKKEPAENTDKGKVIRDDPQFDYLDDLEIGDDFEFGEGGDFEFGEDDE